MPRKKNASLKLVNAEKEPLQEHTTPWGKVWTRGADVLGTFKRTGWTPPTEYRNDYNFRINREGGKLNEVS